MDHFQHALKVLELERMRELLTSYASSALGRKLAGALLPLRDAARLREIHAETMELRDYLSAERLPLSGLSDVAAELERSAARGQPLEPELFFRIAALIEAGLALRQALGRNPLRFPFLARLAAGIEDIPELRAEIPAVLDPRDGVRDDASPRLRQLREEARALRSELRAKAAAILHSPSLRRCFQAEGVTVKGDRYLLPVKADYRASVHGPIRDRSQSGATLYIEPDEISIDGDRLLALLDAERDEVLRILWELTRRTLAHRPALERLQERLAWVDFTYAKASCAAALGLTAPEIDAGGVLELKEARHPYLMWLGRDSRRDLRDLDRAAMQRRVVPLDVRLGGGPRLLIVTGPNTGGKTVALKTIGINVLLALSGVPIAAAAGSRVPLYDDLFADIGDEQSLEQNLSTFSSHLRQIVEVMRHASRRSLILLDELGSGTDPLEGAALGKALLDHFREQGWTAVITTHLGSLKEYAYLHEEAENAAMEFDPRTLKPTYRLLLGVPGSSNALAVARRLGLKEEVIEAAEREIAAVDAPTREIISRMEHSRRRAEKERRRAERARRRVQGEARAYEERVQEVEARREALDLEADVIVDESVRALRSELQPLVARLQNVPLAHRPLVEEIGRKIDLLLVATPLGERREEFARGLRKDDEVYVPKLRAKGRVRKINKGERLLTLLVDGMAVEIGFDDVSWLEGPPARPAAVGQGREAAGAAGEEA
jgi:DNA mismatch repair protein MutS2